ncbi:MAG: hypothetical protein NWT08_08250 [Akkermansiaceae bacterium]|jgi:hypothetical protein|nr:hypothetical protein [Akkermansiaceae bacterium]MDP4647936.1 hypothetical protein [Akkermansiaceae bacterium]MDP4719726.1 hypothetical protein [Akkermansiaceae bacterium]MDP4781281.1 hypothetical protein [Akkermansiaceae bacterium]MDP4846037.1 hypothetical protein [Akkermansiaceae bacterium]
MTSKLATGLALAASFTTVHAGGLYYVPNDTDENIPIKWSVGATLTYDDNTSPGGLNDGDETVSISPFVGVSFVSVTPQTTWDVYARLGLVYYFDAPAGANSDDTYSNSRLAVNLAHRFNERLRFTSRNFVSYELEPDYSYGFASNRQNGEYLYWQTDNSVGYRWSERFATYTGFNIGGLLYDNAANSDRSTWTAYNQFRYQLSPQSVLTASYRYSETSGDGLASDSTNQYFLVGIEHRFSPTTILVANVGAQFREVDGPGRSDTTNPYLEIALRSRINTQFGVRAFARLGMEDYDTVVQSGTGLAEYSDKLTLRVGLSGDYTVSKFLGFFGGVDVISSSFGSGTQVSGVGTPGSPDETLINAYLGASLRFTDNLTGSVSYNFTDSTSDVRGRDYDRNRISVGIQAEF